MGVMPTTGSENGETLSYPQRRVSGVNTAIAPDRAALKGWLPGYLALAAIWGSSFLFIKVGISELHPL
jgi:hypothetical protein